MIFVNRFFWPDHSATSQIVSDLAFHLSRKGRSVAVVTSRLAYDGTLPLLPASANVDGVDVHRVATTGFGRGAIVGRIADYGSFYLSAGRKLAALIERDDIVVAKTDPPLISLVAHAVARRRGARFVNWIQDLYPETAEQLGVSALKGPLGAASRRMRNASLRAADANVAIGERMASRLVACGALPGSVHVIPNWVDETAIRPVAHEYNPLRREWGLDRKFVVGYSGNLGRAHEFETLLGAAERLKHEDDLVFLFIGGGHHASRLGEEVGRRGLSHLFMFKPYQPAERLSQSLSAPDVHWLSLLPQIEGLIVPSKFYGIAAAGRPVFSVADPEGEVSSIVVREGCGIAIAPGDAAGLAAALSRLRMDHALRTRMGDRARALSEAVFSRRRALEAWERILTPWLDRSGS
ncbi:MAG: glycosyltransferase family 4 protein [Burkholderiales bacterium]|nr:glycosyltransferase family 4 protein [Burkholderiales bacterium]